MPHDLPPESPAQLRRRLDRFFDAVAKLMARRWLREQREEASSDAPKPKRKRIARRR